MGWLKAIAQLIGLGDFLARWLHDEEVEKTGEQKHELKNLEQQQGTDVQQQQNREGVHALSDADLDRELRRSAGGTGQSGA